MAGAIQEPKPEHSLTGPTASLDPAALMRIKNLQLRAKMVVEGFYNGLHRSPLHGNSVEFREYRPYTFGDDLRNLDWKLYARSDRYYIKKFDDETQRECTLIHDQSRSMDYGTIGYSKAEFSSTVLATLAYFLNLQRDSVGLLTFDEAIRQYLSPRRAHGQMRRLFAGLAQPASGLDTNMERPLEEAAAVAKRRGLIVLASDFLAPVASMEKGLGLLRARGHQVLLLRVLDPTELDFSIDSPSMMFDMETGSEIYVDPIVAKSGYRDAFVNHREELTKLCGSIGIDYFEMVTNDLVENALHRLISTGGNANRIATSGSGGSSASAIERSAVEDDVRTTEVDSFGGSIGSGGRE